MKATKWRPALKVTADGKGLATHAGSRLLAEMADRSGLTDALSEALAPMCKRRRRHDPGKVISDLAVTIAGGGDALANLLGLRLQADVFGAVASVPTAFRVIDAIDDTLLAAMRAAQHGQPSKSLRVGIVVQFSAHLCSRPDLSARTSEQAGDSRVPEDNRPPQRFCNRSRAFPGTPPTCESVCPPGRYC